MRLLSFLAAGLLAAQINSVLSVIPPEQVTGKRGEVVTAEFQIQLRNGYHVNSHTPSDEYLIPLKMTWNDGVAQALDTAFPQPKMEKYSFSQRPLSVFAGDFKARTRFKVSPSAPFGQSTLTGKLRYQACNDRVCLPPRSADVKLNLVVFH